MKSALPISALLVFFASCTTAYQAGQTPDDVYYSPTRPQHDEYVRTNDRQDRYRYDEPSADDRYLRMKVRNRRTWSDLDYYYSDPYAYNYNYRNSYNNFGNVYYNSPWDNYSSWNYYYNPYNNYCNNYYRPYGGTKIVVINPSRQPVYNRPRTFNLNTYNPPSASRNPYDAKSTPRRVYRSDNGNYNTGSNDNNSRSYNNDRGSGLRSVFGNNNSNTSSQSTTPVRTERSTSVSTPSSSPSRSTTSGGSAPVRRF